MYYHKLRLTSRKSFLQTNDKKMKSLKLICACLIIGAGIWACDSRSSWEKEDNTAHLHDLHQNHHHRLTGLMAAHDSIMPRIGELVQLSDSLKDKLHRLDSLPAGRGLSQSKNLTEKGTRLLKEMEEAEQLMMSWMHHFHPDTLETLEEASIEKYVAEQETGIRAVKEKMESSILEARRFLQE